MTSHLHASTQQLIRDIERKDRRFRYAQTVFMVLLLGGFIAGGYFAAQGYQKAQASRDRANHDVITAINGKLAEQSKQLQCVVEFFTIADRSNLRIKSVDDCFTTEVGKIDINAPIVREGDNSLNFTQSQSQPLVVSNPAPAEVAPPPASTSPPPGPPVMPSPDPLIRICVPLTDVCVVL